MEKGSMHSDEKAQEPPHDDVTKSVFSCKHSHNWSTRQGLKLSSLTGSTYLLPGTYTNAATRQVHPYLLPPL